MTGQNADEVRREAFQAAAAAVDRFLERIGEPLHGRFDDLGAVARDRFQSELARVVDLNLEMVRNAFDVYGNLLGPDSLDPDGDAGKLVLRPGVPGSESVAMLWLHNFDAEPITDVSFVGSRLIGRDGQGIDTPAWSFLPPAVSVPPATAVPVLVMLAIPPATAKGSYTGSISTVGRPGEPVEVRLDVIVMEPIAHDSW